MNVRSGWALLAMLGLAACGGGGGGGTDTPPPAVVDVSVVAAPPAGLVAGGGTAVYTMTVGNAGPDAAQSVAITNTLGSGQTLGTVTCPPSGGAVCPATLGATMVAPTLPRNGTLRFSIPAVVTAGTNGTIMNTMGVSATGDSNAANNSATANGTAYSANVSVSNTTSSAQFGAGMPAIFVATVANSGPATALNVNITHSVVNGAAGAVACTAAGGATCPAVLGASMDVPTLPTGGSLTFEFATTAGTSVGTTLASTVQVASAGDPAAANNSAVASAAIAQDARNGTYAVAATNALSYVMTADFNANQYTMTGNGLSRRGSFAADATGNTFVIAGNARFRIAPDLLVGGFDFGGGVKPFVGARNLVTSVGALSGTFNTLGINIANDGTVDSRIYTSQFTAGTLRACLDNIIYAIANCPAASVWTYALTVDAGVFTGVDSVHNDTTTFRVAKSGTTTIVLRAGASSDGQGRRFRISLPETSGLGSGAFVGASTTGSWGTATLGATSYAVSGVTSAGAAVSDSATLIALGSLSPQGIRLGARASDSASVFVMQGGPLGVLVGARNGLAVGYMEIGVP
jgi:uncharacterized repeat protein (TIGR01451 family)